MSNRGVSRSTIFPLPSSPHCAPSTARFIVGLRFYSQTRVAPCARDESRRDRARAIAAMTSNARVRVKRKNVLHFRLTTLRAAFLSSISSSRHRHVGTMLTPRSTLTRRVARGARRLALAHSGARSAAAAAAARRCCSSCATASAGPRRSTSTSSARRPRRNGSCARSARRRRFRPARRRRPAPAPPSTPRWPSSAAPAPAAASRRRSCSTSSSSCAPSKAFPACAACCTTSSTAWPPAATASS